MKTPDFSICVDYQSVVFYFDESLKNAATTIYSTSSPKLTGIQSSSSSVVSILYPSMEKAHNSGYLRHFHDYPLNKADSLRNRETLLVYLKTRDQEVIAMPFSIEM